MRRRIIAGLALYSVILLVAGGYILRMIHDATGKLDNLIMMHQVEILREHYLIQIRGVQNDLSLSGGRHSRTFDAVVAQTRRMRSFVETCHECHVADRVTPRIDDLRRETDAYEEALSRVYTIDAGVVRTTLEKDRAFVIGETLSRKVGDMIAVTGSRLEAQTQNALREIERTKSILYALVASGPIASLLLGFFFVSGISKPLGVLLHSTRRLKTDLDHRVEGLKAEFGELGDAFNEMAASLQEQMQKRQRVEQMAVLGELSAGLAHEVKNPLAGIKVAMQVLAAEASLGQEEREIIDRVGLEVQRLEALMKSLLNFARPPKPQLVEIDVNAVIRSTLALHGRDERMSPDRPGGIRVVARLEEELLATVDPMQLQQVILNLVINAIDAMPNGGTLSVTTRRDSPRTFTVDIGDSGKGIDPQHMDRIFQPFFTTKPKGTGLGLAISRQLIERHGGTLTAGAHAGGGTLFEIRLPVQPAGWDGE